MKNRIAVALLALTLFTATSLVSGASAATVPAKTSGTATKPGVTGLTTCTGAYALCAASTCKPTGKTISVAKAGGGTATFPEVSCQCPVLTGTNYADLKGGNMKGSCAPSGPGHIWSTFSNVTQIPQAMDNWKTAAAPTQVCPAAMGVGQTASNCWSMDCTIGQTVNGVQIANCLCPAGESLRGTPIAANVAVLIRAGGGNPAYCKAAPVSVSPPQPLK